MERENFRDLAHKISTDILKSSDKRLQKKVQEKEEYNDCGLQGFIYQHMAVHYVAHALAIAKILGFTEEKLHIVMQEIITASLGMATKIVNHHSDKKTMN
jgi:hypothetical protein